MSPNVDSLLPNDKLNAISKIKKDLAKELSNYEMLQNEKLALYQEQQKINNCYNNLGQHLNMLQEYGKLLHNMDLNSTESIKLLEILEQQNIKFNKQSSTLAHEISQQLENKASIKEINTLKLQLQNLLFASKTLQDFLDLYHNRKTIYNHLGLFTANLSNGISLETKNNEKKIVADGDEIYIINKSQDINAMSIEEKQLAKKEYQQTKLLPNILKINKDYQINEIIKRKKENTRSIKNSEDNIMFLKNQINQLQAINANINSNDSGKDANSSSSASDPINKTLVLSLTPPSSGNYIKKPTVSVRKFYYNLKSLQKNPTPYKVVQFQETISDIYGQIPESTQNILLKITYYKPIPYYIMQSLLKNLSTLGIYPYKSSITAIASPLDKQMHPVLKSEFSPSKLTLQPEKH